MTLRDKFGWQHGVEEYLPLIDETLDAMSGEYSGWDHFWRLPLDKNAVATSYFLEGKIAKARKYAAEMVKDSINYFFGGWRARFKTGLGTLDSKWWHKHATWMKPYAEALCWATCLNDWASLSRLIRYPDDECERDATRSEEERAFWLLCTSYLRQEPTSKRREYVTIIKEGELEKPKYLMEVVNAIEIHSPSQFQRRLEDYLDYYRKREFRKSSLDRLLCFDGSTLLNIGKRQGLPFEAPEGLEDHIIRLDIGQCTT